MGWYSGIDVSLRGRFSLSGKTASPRKRGDSYRPAVYKRLVRFLEWRVDGKPKGIKFFTYDDKRRVTSITLLMGGKIIDAWHYEYRPAGTRRAKVVVTPDGTVKQRTKYDAKGNKIAG